MKFIKNKQMESKSINMKCKDAEFSCDSRLLSFSKALSGQNSLSSKFSSQAFTKVLSFYASHDFDANSFPKEQKSIESNNFKDYLSVKDQELLKDYIINDSELRVYMMKELIELAYGLGFNEFKNMLLTALATHFKCGLKEEDLLNYKIKNGLEDKWILKEDDVKKIHKETIEKLNLQIQEALQG